MNCQGEVSKISYSYVTNVTRTHDQDFKVLFFFSEGKKEQCHTNGQTFSLVVLSRYKIICNKIS